MLLHVDFVGGAVHVTLGAMPLRRVRMWTMAVCASSLRQEIDQTWYDPKSLERYRGRVPCLLRLRLRFVPVDFKNSRADRWD